jgi:hypothetical protein
VRPRLEQSLREGLNFLADTSLDRELRESLNLTREQFSNHLIEGVKKQCLVKRHWLKAVEVILDLACLHFRNTERTQP